MERSSRNHETTPEMRGAIVAMHEVGIPSEDIARQLKVCKKTVQKWIRRYTEDRSLATRPRSGPRCTTPRQDATIVAEVLANPHTNSTKIKAALDIQCSGATIRRRLREAGISHHISATKSHLASDVSEIRLQMDFDQRHNKIRDAPNPTNIYRDTRDIFNRDPLDTRDRDVRPARDHRDTRGLERERDRERDRDRDRDYRNNVHSTKRDRRDRNFPEPDKDFRSREPYPGTNAVPSPSAIRPHPSGPPANIPPALLGSDQEKKSKVKMKKKAIKYGNLMTKQDEAKCGVFVFQGIKIHDEEIKLEKFEDEIKEEVIDFEEEEEVARDLSEESTNCEICKL